MREREATRVYQPIYAAGGGINPDYPYQRECEHRYQPIRELASQFNRHFSVLDIGANYGYFDMRLMEEFDCTCAMIDKKLIDPIIRANKVEDRCMWMLNHPSAKVYEALSLSEHFDIVLCLAVLHHIDDPSLAMKAACNLGSYTFFEIPGPNDTLAAHPEKHDEIYECFDGHEPIEWFDSHVSDTRRPLYLLENKPVLFNQTIDAPDRDAPCYSTYDIETDFDSCMISIDRGNGKVERRDFIPGMNLYNFQRLNGRHPTTDVITAELDKHRDHPDFETWNFVIGKGIHPIDEEPK